MHLFDYLTSLYAPHICLGCGVEGVVLCSLCCVLPKPINRCYRCHRINDEGKTCRSCRSSTNVAAVRSVARYEGVAKQLVWRLKFAYARAAAEEIARLMLPLMEELHEGLLVPVPTATNRVRQRGYDQAALIARMLSRSSGLDYAALLRRHGQAQQHGASRRQRQQQLQQAFTTRTSYDIKGARIILIDDVVTTGATLEAAAATLKAAGAARVQALTFAHA